MGDRIGALIWADARDPDLLRVAGPVGRIEPEQAQGLEYRDAALGEQFGPLWATYWFQVGATVPAEWAGVAGRPALGQPQRGHAVARRTVAAGPEHLPDGARVDAHGARAGAGRRAARPARRAGLQRHCSAGSPQPYATVEPVVLDRCQLARFDARPGSCSTTSTCCGSSRPTTPTASTRAWAGRLLCASSTASATSGARTTARPGPRPARSCTALLATGTARTRTSCRRSATRTSTPPGCGRWPRRTASACAPSARSSPTWTATRSTGSPARRRSSTTGSSAATRRSTTRIRAQATAGRWVPVGGTLGRARLQPALGRVAGAPVPATASASSSASSAAAAASSGTPTCSATTASCRRSCAAPASTRFLTQKLSWNRFNPPAAPHVHAGRASTARGARALPAGRHLQRRRRRRASCARAPRDYKDHDRSRAQPAAVRLRRRRRRADAGDARDAAARGDLQGVPRTAIARAATSSSTALEAERGDLPTLVGELYFEYHRGTYTTQAAVKRGNRDGERLLHDVELLAALGARRGAAPSYPARALERAVAAAAAEPVPRHPARPLDRRGVRGRRARPRRDRRRAADAAAAAALAAPAAATRGRAAEHARRSPAPRSPSAGRRAGLGRGPAYGVRRASPRPPTPSPCSEPATASCSRTAQLRADARRATGCSLAGRARQRARGAARRRATCSSSTTTGRSTGTPGTSTRSTWRPCSDCAAGDLVASSRDDAAARRAARSSAGSAGPARMRQTVRLDAGLAAARVPLPGRLAGAHTMLKVLFPVAVRARQRDVRDAVRRRRAPDPLLEPPRPGPLRGARPPLRRPLRARLRGGAADRLASTATATLRRRRCGSACCARPTSPDPAPTGARTRSPTRCCRTPAAGSEAGVVGRGRPLRRRRSGGRRRARAAVVRFDRRPDLVLDTVKRGRGLRRAGAAALRGARRPRQRAACGSATAFAAAVRCNLLEDEGEPLAVDGGEIVVAYGPHEIVSVLVR